MDGTAGLEVAVTDRPRRADPCRPGPLERQASFAIAGRLEWTLAPRPPANYRAPRERTPSAASAAARTSRIRHMLERSTWCRPTGRLGG
jgi:hypothetical protein